MSSPGHSTCSKRWNAVNDAAESHTFRVSRRDLQLHHVHFLLRGDDSFVPPINPHGTVWPCRQWTMWLDVVRMHCAKCNLSDDQRRRTLKAFLERCFKPMSRNRKRNKSYVPPCFKVPFLFLSTKEMAMWLSFESIRQEILSHLLRSFYSSFLHLWDNIPPFSLVFATSWVVESPRDFQKLNGALKEWGRQEDFWHTPCLSIKYNAVGANLFGLFNTTRHKTCQKLTRPAIFIHMHVRNCPLQQCISFINEKTNIHLTPHSVVSAGHQNISNIFFLRQNFAQRATHGISSNLYALHVHNG